MAESRGIGAERVYLDLVATYQSAVLNYIRRLVGDLAVAEDLTQETFMRAYQALGRLELEPGAAARRRAWLYRIAHNAATDHLRRKSRLEWLPLSSVHRGTGNPEQAAAIADPVHRALDELQPADRELLLLFAAEGLSASEVAEVLGITSDAARKRHQRARDAFRAAYARAAE